MATDFNSKKISETYSEGIIAERLSLRPVNLELIGNVRNKKVLDLGCGYGRYSILLAKRGAKVTAIDPSEYQIRIAKRKNYHQNIIYLIKNGADLSFVKDSSIDLVFMNLVVPDIGKKERLKKIFKETKRVLKTRGRFVFSVLHPLYLHPEQDKFDKAFNFKKENYFKEGSLYNAQALTEKGNRVVFTETHFSLNYISNLLGENNFVIKSLREGKAVPSKGIYLPKYLVIEAIIGSSKS